MTFDIQDALIILVEIICCEIFFETFAERKGKRAYTPYFVVMGLSGAVYFLSYILEDQFILKEIFIIIITALVMVLYLTIKVIKSLVLAVLYQSLVLVVDYCGFSLINYIFFSYENMSEQYLLGGRLVIVFCKICLFLMILIINRKMKKQPSEVLTDNEWIRLIFFPAFTIVIIAAMISAFKYVDRPEQANVLFVVAFGMVGMNIWVFFLLNDILFREKKIRNEKVLILETRNRANMYQSISENLEKQRKRTHEYKNQIICIEGLLHQKEYDKAEKYVKWIAGVFSTESDAINTNHVIVNAILNTKYQEAADKNIVLTIKVNNLEEIWLEDADIVAILSNLLDNAIEATEKCQKNRIVRLKLMIEDELVISVKNTYAEKPRVQDGKLLTNKQEKAEHGIGTQNIIDVVEKYNGSYIIKVEEHEFLFSILIPRVRI